MSHLAVSDIASMIIIISLLWHFGRTQKYETKMVSSALLLLFHCNSWLLSLSFFLRQWTFILWNVGNIRSNVRKNTSIIFATLLPHPLFYAICEHTTGNLKDITLNLLGIFAHVVESVSWAYLLFYSWIVDWKKIFILSSLDCCKFYRRIDRLSFLCIWIISSEFTTYHSSMHLNFTLIKGR